jgi:hypothetical protein
MGVWVMASRPKPPNPNPQSPLDLYHIIIIGTYFYYKKNYNIITYFYNFKIMLSIKFILLQH